MVATDRDLIRAHTLDQRRRGLQETTITVRVRIIRRFADHMGVRGLLAAGAEDIEQYLDRRHANPHTRSSYLSHFKVFYTWAVAAGHLERDPTLPIPRARARKGLPRPIGDSDLDLALAMAVGHIRVILSLAAFEGMRCIEIGRLVREDILDERDPPVVVVRGKGSKTRVVPLHDRAWHALQLLPMPRSGPILRRDSGDAYPAWAVSHAGNDYLHGIGIDATVHQLRHWFATTLYRTSGRDLLLVRDLMGHANVDTTSVYAAFDREGAAAAVSALAVRPSRPKAGVPSEQKEGI